MEELKEIKQRKDLIVVEYPSLFGPLRTVFIDKHDMLFCAKDACLALEYKDYKDAMKKHVPKEDRVTLKAENFSRVCETHTLGMNNYGMAFINEGALYRLISSSKMPKAEVFRKWVFNELIPTFRKKGKYDMDDLLKSSYLSSIKQLPGFDEDEKFKRDCTNSVNELAKAKGMLTGIIWNKLARVLFDRFDLNVNREITKFVKKNKLKKRPSIRQFLDVSNYKVETYLAFEILRHDENIRTNPEYLTHLIAMCKLYYDELTPFERTGIRIGLQELFRKGILTPSEDYAAIESSETDEYGGIRYNFKE